MQLGASTFVMPFLFKRKRNKELQCGNISMPRSRSIEERQGRWSSKQAGKQAGKGDRKKGGVRVTNGEERAKKKPVRRKENKKKGALQCRCRYR